MVYKDRRQLITFAYSHNHWATQR